jgi:uncharacterized repeat protein (TIGR02543 family)
VAGGSATAPANPSRDGYTFVGWDKPFNNIQSHLDIRAVYKPLDISFIVTFVDWDDTILKEEIVAQGDTAHAPASPSRDGYTFIGWDKPFTNVQGNIIVNALYEKEIAIIEKIKVIFVDWDGTILDTQVIDKGSDATAPSNPSRDGYTFTGWSGSYTNVQQNQMVIATYTKNATQNEDSGVSYWIWWAVGGGALFFFLLWFLLFRRTYKVTFFNEQGEEIKSLRVGRGRRAKINSLPSPYNTMVTWSLYVDKKYKRTWNIEDDQVKEDVALYVR